MSNAQSTPVCGKLRDIDNSRRPTRRTLPMNIERPLVSTVVTVKHVFPEGE